MTDDLRAWLLAHPLETLALTLYGEARGEPVEGRIAVGSVIRNRAARGYRGGTIAEVCLYPLQFSCWQPVGGVANYTHVIGLAERMAAGQAPQWATVKQAEIFAETAWIAEGLIRGVIRDRVAGARHYLARYLYESRPPKWARGAPVICEVGGHVFVRAA